jgi:hypothetical protein
VAVLSEPTIRVYGRLLNRRRTVAGDAQSPEERGTWHSATIRKRPRLILFARADSP